MSSVFSFRSKLGVAALASLALAATGAGAATVHHMAVNSATGSEGAAAFLQTSATGSALQGEVAASANTSLKLPFGVLGEYDPSGSTFGVGVVGISTTGYAVGAEALGANPAIIALAKGTSDGIDAYTSADTGYGVYGEDDSPDGSEAVFGYTKSDDGIGVDGSADLSGANSAGVVGFGHVGTGIYGVSHSSTQADAAIQAASSVAGTELFSGLVVGTDNNEYESTILKFASANSSGTVLNSVDASSDFSLNGDVILTGSVFTGCSNFPETAPKTDCHEVTDAVAPSQNGTMMQTYAAHEAAPTTEDEGETQLHNGYAHVALDPAFASMIPRDRAYLVFTTPLDECNGLYVTNRTATGFDVRELHGGRSAVAFDYRIVAGQFGRNGKRLAAVDAHRGVLRAVPSNVARRVAHLDTLDRTLAQQRRVPVALLGPSSFHKR